MAASAGMTTVPADRTATVANVLKSEIFCLVIILFIIFFAIISQPQCSWLTGG
jgi:hypothetical protein